MGNKERMTKTNDEQQIAQILYLTKMHATHDKFVEVLGLSVQQICDSYNSKVFPISFDGLNIQVIVWVTAKDAIC